ncbi:Ig-like domain-containing protein [Clostridium ganghwense]|uniref:Ig-like domain-containing protein n=1 Tax=Clostridium ganghwense TaxID=312089 RepID=A0ABT4CPI9_9CLOT|nr:Ig-like domain-containing protein [Clostridium ganghwense]MCY6370972.1 Ig-like domain-containing protein [Clostridium ganghwense]
MNNRRILNFIMFLALVLGVFSFNLKEAFAAAETQNWNTEVKEESVLPDKEWKITFTTGVDERTLTDSNIYIEDSKKRKFEDIKIEPVESDIEGSTDGLKEVKEVKIIPTKEYTQNETYSICVSNGVKSKGGRKLVTPYKLQFKVKKIDSDYFKIRNIEAVSKNVINVYFTHPINEEAQQSLYYEILEDGSSFVKGGYRSMDVQALKDCNNGVQIYLKEESLSEDENYTMKILGDLTSGYGVRLLDGFGDELDFKGTSEENVELSLLEAVVRNSNHLELSFNKAVDIKTAENIENYSVRDTEKSETRKVTKATVSKEGDKVVLEVEGTLKKDHKYKINVRNIKDNIKESTFSETDYLSEKMSASDYNLSIVSAEALSNRVVVVKFDRNLDEKKALDRYNFKVEGVTDKSYSKETPGDVFFDKEEDGKTVKLYLGKSLSYNKTYRVIASDNLKDEYGEESTKDIKHNFEGLGSSDELPYIKNVVTVGKNHVKVEFGQEMKNGDSNIDPLNYLLERTEGENKKITIGCSEVKYVNPTTIILKFEDMDDNKEYILNMKSLVDYNDSKNDNYANGVEVKAGTY